MRAARKDGSHSRAENRRRRKRGWKRTTKGERKERCRQKRVAGGSKGQRTKSNKNEKAKPGRRSPQPATAAVHRGGREPGTKAQTTRKEPRQAPRVSEGKEDRGAETGVNERASARPKKQREAPGNRILEGHRGTKPEKKTGGENQGGKKHRTRRRTKSEVTDARADRATRRLQGSAQQTAARGERSHRNGNRAIEEGKLQRK